MAYNDQQQPLVSNPYDQQGGYPQQGGYGAPPPGPPGQYGAPPPGPPMGYPGGDAGQGYPPQQGYPQQGYPPQGQPQGYPGQDSPQGYPQQAPPPQAGGYFGGAPPPMPMGSGPPEMVIAQSQMLAIKQKVSLVEAAGDLAGGTIPCAEACCEKENEYEIYDKQHAQMIFYAKEKSEMFACPGGRCCCNPAHELQLEISQGPGQPPVMTIDRPFKCMQGCPALCDMCQQEATLRVGGTVYGGAKQPCCGGLCKPKVEVKRDNVDGDAFGYVEGPCCCFGGLTEMCLDQNFPVMDASDNKIGQITKEKPEGFQQAVQEAMTDSDLFTLSFDNPQIPPRDKLLLLSTVLLLDYMFFEQNKPWECDAINQTCTCTCCNMYLCGAYIPCTCKCGGGSQDDSGN
eukprot:TRINITY_DN10515_c0_g1_i4.p1 TRINITY_DN10515_c0_g1~~TRINITY_DN10515_c0_g1_i4.p1  ORF type:complete len:427 (+),score=144.80 TRINITY_DN10515_c0_g1_i4:86-1282(+)